jgi:alkylation response protein AidB-like acyl-CoA dehydrogenase
MSYAAAAGTIVAQIMALPEFARVQALFPDAGLDEATLAGIIESAGDLAEGVIAPFNLSADRVGCTLKDGRVGLAPGHHAAWEAFVAGGWTTIESGPAWGGAGLPMVVHSACEELFNRASCAFGMLPTPMRCATRVIERYADPALQAEWAPRLVDGSWAATICISEPDAGSDVPRLRTMAEPRDDGSWRVTGEKCWISFGDHDLTPRIAHMVLARTPDGGPGTAGISLFLVPSDIDGTRNAVVVRRIEEKLGLHASPTCALGFEGATGYLIGTPGRGLAQLFTMIIGMRLSVGSQGAGLAGAAASLAWRYASERRQGGKADAPPVTIDRHGDVQRMLLAAAARAEVTRALVLTASAVSDLQAHETDAAARAEAGHLLAWLLPITKNFSAEAASLCANDAIQVLGGAGYTREWPAEQILRDARVLSIYEGTSGMQALDLTLRRVLGDEGRAYRAFLSRARADQAALGNDALGALLDMLETSAGGLDKAKATIVAYPFLQLASLATTGWMAARLAALSGTPVHDHLAALGRHWLVLAHAQAQAEAALVDRGSGLVAAFADVEPAMLG